MSSRFSLFRGLGLKAVRLIDRDDVELKLNADGTISSGGGGGGTSFGVDVSAGTAFIYNGVKAGANQIDSGSIVRWELTPSASVVTTLRAIMGMDARGKLALFEGPSVIVAGTDVSSEIFNRDRRSATSATMTIEEEPTITNDGDRIIQRFGVTGQFLSLTDEPGYEGGIVLDPNTTYQLWAKNEDASAKDATITLMWTEEPV